MQCNVSYPGGDIDGDIQDIALYLCKSNSSCPCCVRAGPVGGASTVKQQQSVVVELFAASTPLHYLAGH